MRPSKCNGFSSRFSMCPHVSQCFLKMIPLFCLPAKCSVVLMWSANNSKMAVELFGLACAGQTTVTVCSGLPQYFSFFVCIHRRFMRTSILGRKTRNAFGQIQKNNCTLL